MQSVSKSECVCACLRVQHFSKTALIPHSDPECTYTLIQGINVNPSIIFDG